MKKISNWLFYIFISIIIIFIIYSYRAIYLEHYNNNYLRDLYDHSQWNMAISKRPVSDNIVYKVTGYDLVTNWSFFKVDPQTPVLGKYLYGYSILLLKNAEVVLILIFVSTILIFYYLSKYILKNHYLAILSTTLFVSEPIIFYQISVSMLDLPQLFFLIIHIISIIKLTENNKLFKKLFWIFLSSISLGGFISLKIGFFASAIIFADFIYLFKKNKFIYLLPILGTSLIIYILSYLPYFIQGHSLIEFLKAEKWVILSYWLSSKSKPIYGMVFLSTLTGFIKGWFQGSGWERVKEWTIFWPLYIFLFLKLVFSKNEKNKEEKYLLYLTLSLLFLYIIVPFNARYLVLVIPFLIILTIKQIKKINKLVIKFILIIFAAQVINFLYPGPNDTLGVINQVWRNGSYQDLYSFLDENTTETITRNQFWRQGQTIERSIELINKKIKINNIKLTFPWENKTSTSLEIIYYTPLGKITNIKKIELVRESNVWKIKWNYNLLFPDFEPGDQIVFEHDYGQYGKLINKDGKILSEVTYTPVFYLTPSLIKDESIVQNQLTRLTGLKKHDLEYIYKADWQPDWSVRIAPLKNNLSLNLINLTLLDESISIKNEVLSMVNNKYPQLEPSSGGEIILKKKNGTIKSLLKKNKIDGKDIYL